MKCEATGIIIAELPSAGGQGRNGKDWEKREYVLTTTDVYPKNLRFAIYSFDGPIDSPLKIGDRVKVLFTVEAREYNGNWYNEVKAYHIDKMG